MVVAIDAPVENNLRITYLGRMLTQRKPIIPFAVKHRNMCITLVAGSSSLEMRIEKNLFTIEDVSTFLIGE